MSWDGRYRLERTLGEGGMGRVLLARDLPFGGRTIALKVLLPEYRDCTTGFLQEFVTQRRFRHPNIPDVYDLGFAEHPRGGEVPYMTLEYVRGIPLAWAAPRTSRVERIWAWMVRLLRALDHVHRCGYVHRDLKPGNILVDMDTSGEEAVHLIDLGVAARNGEPPEEVFIGTPEYCAPELLSGRRFDQRADLYAFGLVFYEAVEHGRPWPGSDEDELLRQRLEGDPPAMTHPDCPAGVESLIRRLLRPEPRDRPTTAAEVLSELGHAVGRRFALETEEAFARWLELVPVPGRRGVHEAGERCLFGSRSESGGGLRMLLVDSRRGYGASEAVGELADQAAVQGWRVIRLTPESPREALDAIAPALEILQRLRQSEDGSESEALRGVAGAAALLTRLHAPTLLTIDDLQRADVESLRVLRAAFSGSANAKLRVLATVDLDEEPVAPRALRLLGRTSFTERLQVGELDRDGVRSWLERALGREVVDETLLERLATLTGGAPVGLRAALRELQRRGVIERIPEGYTLRDDIGRVLEPVRPEAEEERIMLLACLRDALPEEVVVRYLGELGGEVPALIARGSLARNGDGRVHVADRDVRDHYEQLSDEQRQQGHRRLARALHHAEPFHGQRRLVAEELMRSDRPVLAAPHLVVAANEAVGADEGDAAAEALDRAEALLQTHASDTGDADAWRWWVTLWKARVRLALAQGAVETLDRAAVVLVELGTEAGHMPTLRFGLETRIWSARERGDWDALVQHAESRRELDGEAPGVDARGLYAWAQGLRLRVRGEPTEALEHLDDAFEMTSQRPRPEVELRVAEARAELLVALEWVRRARKATEHLQQRAHELADQPRELHARVLDAEVRLQAGRPEAALEGLRAVAREMPAEHVRRTAAHLELALARGHRAFGWTGSVVEHARQAVELADRDRDRDTAIAARLLEAASDPDGDLEEVPEPETADLRAARRELLLARWIDALSQEPGERELAAAEALAREAERQQAWPRAAWALALSATAAARIGRARRAVSLAERALSHADRRPGREGGHHLLLHRLARARRQVDDRQAAEELAIRARAHLRRIASTIDDGDLREAWLNAPEQAAVLRDSPPTSG